MTEKEKKMKAYVNAVERRLELPREIRARVMSDFSSSIAARREAGQSDEEIYAELGSPKQAAAELNRQMEEFTYRKSPWRFAFLALASVSGLWVLGHLLMQFALIQMLKVELGEASVGIIGGADGPTAIFMTSKVGIDWDWVILLALMIVGVLGFLRLRKCRRKGPDSE